MKLSVCIACVITPLLLLVDSPPLRAESVFLKDGSIIEGAVISETSDTLTITTPGRLKTEIPRTEIIRVLINDGYKKLVTIRKKDGTEITAHVVEELPDSFIVRATLASRQETGIPKRDIMEFLGEKPASRTNAGLAHVYTPREAAQISIIPIRSGSLLVGKDLLGLGLVFAKTGSLLFPLALTLGSLFKPPGSQDAMDDSSSSYDTMSDEKIKQMALISLGAWVLLTAADMIYSYHRVKSFNERAGSGTKAGASFGFSVMPLVRSGAPEPGERRASGRVEGVAAMAVMRF